MPPLPKEKNLQIKLANTYTGKTAETVATIYRKKHNINIFYDTEGNVLDPLELSPKEKGLVFEYIRYKKGDVVVHMPMRVMDRALSLIVKKYPSFRSTGSITAVFNNKAKAAKDIRSCIQDFILSFTDWEDFKKLSNYNKWVLRNNKLPINWFTNEVKQLIEEIDKLTKELTKYRSLLEEDLDKSQVLLICESITKMKKHHIWLQELLIQFYTKIDNSLKEERELDESMKIEIAATEIRSLIIPSVIDIDELYKIALSKVLATSKEDAKPEWIKDLGFELNRLSKYFPALRHLETDKNDIIISLSGVKIKLTPDVVIIEGDLSVLKMYTKNKLICTKKGNSRFQSLDVGNTAEQ